MEFFHEAKAVRLRSQYEKYLVAKEDEESVRQDRNGESKRARWTVEFVTGSNSLNIRLKSCYGKYLTASNLPFLIGLTGRTVLQTLPSCLDCTIEWEPIKDHDEKHIRLKSCYSQSFLRANGGLPPWRNSVTHTADGIPNSDLKWDVEILDIHHHDQGTSTSHVPVYGNAYVPTLAVAHPPVAYGSYAHPPAPRKPRNGKIGNLKYGQVEVGIGALRVNIKGAVVDATRSSFT